MPKLLITEDDEDLRFQMKWALAEDYQVFTAEDRAGALAILKEERPSVITLDLGLPPDPTGVEEGFFVLSDVLNLDPMANVIVITGREEKEYALKAVEEGAYDFFCKPVEIDELKVVLKRAVHLYDLELENRKLRQNQMRGDSFEFMLGTSEAMQKVFSVIRKVAASEASVLIEGESGTGKELAALAIHNLSPRKDKPFVTINCAAIPENLLESELFGHEKGAFTGAYAKEKGHLELAHGGTLFLDEIGDLPQALQPKLLRFLQEQTFVRVGGRKEIPINARVIAATNMDLKEGVGQGRFREDLYYRLGVVSITLPPLRDRQGDIPLLATYFVGKFAQEAKKKITGFTPQALRMMESHGWPGNVREMENRIRRAAIMADGQLLTPSDLELDSEFKQYTGMSLKEAREALERYLITKAMTRYKGNISQIAMELGIGRPTLYELMEKLKIKK